MIKKISYPKTRKMGLRRSIQDLSPSKEMGTRRVHMYHLTMNHKEILKKENRSQIPVARSHSTSVLSQRFSMESSTSNMTN